MTQTTHAPTATRLRFRKRDLGGWLVVAELPDATEVTLGWVVKNSDGLWHAYAVTRYSPEGRATLLGTEDSRRHAAWEILFPARRNDIQVNNSQAKIDALAAMPDITNNHEEYSRAWDAYRAMPDRLDVLEVVNLGTDGTGEGTVFDRLLDSLG